MFDSVEVVIDAIRKGEMVIITDDENRENEGDLIMAADLVTPDAINFMAKYARGLICTPISQEIADNLQLRRMVENEGDIFKTAFTFTLDAKEDVTTGISAADRASTIKKMIAADAKKSDFNYPGHVFPLIAKTGGVLVRTGHTEAAVDLSKIAGFSAAGVICEIMNDDGTMARVKDLEEFRKTHNLKWTTIDELIRYRRKIEKLVECQETSNLPTEYGEFKIAAYTTKIDDKEHIALIYGDIKSSENVLVRVHSECFTGDVLGSLRCDCGEQLKNAMKQIAENGSGVIVYLRQEGRGIGLVNKIKAYHLQDQGLDTVEANHKLGFESDLREYGIGAQILKDLGIKNIILLSNNPRKIVGISGYGINIVERRSLICGRNKYNEKYLDTKKSKLDHIL